MSAKRIYLVMGDTGEYSDHCQWIVCAYTNREDADARVTLLEALAKGAAETELYDWKARKKIEENVRNSEHGDTDAHIDYTGISWSVYEIDLKEAL